MTPALALALLVGAVAAGATAADAGPAPPPGQRLVPASAPITEMARRVKDPARDPLPADAALAEQIRRGYALFQDTPRQAQGLVASALSCGSCHLHAGQKEGALPLVGIASIFPEYNRRSGRVFSLEDRVVGCFLRSLNSPAVQKDPSGEHENAAPHPGPDAPEVQAITAYLRWLSEGVTAEDTRAWRDPQAARLKRIPVSRLDPARGARLYRDRCEICHGRDGQGVDVGGVHPAPLWGPRSWNDGAGAARVHTLASFVRHAMPYSAPGTLTDEEAQQIAAYIDSRPRPAFPEKGRDYQAEPLPEDAVYYRQGRR